MELSFIVEIMLLLRSRRF